MNDTPPSLARIQRILDALSAAARAGDADAYRRHLVAAEIAHLTEEQILDAYTWGRRGQGAADFDHHGRTR